MFVAIILVPIEIYYWFIWFPKAWKNGSTREIRDLKFYADYVKKHGV